MKLTKLDKEMLERIKRGWLTYHPILDYVRFGAPHGDTSPIDGHATNRLRKLINKGLVVIPEHDGFREVTIQLAQQQPKGQEDAN